MRVPTTFKEDEMRKQGKRTRALDSRGRPVAGIYVRDGRFIAGFKVEGRWHMRTLEATTLTEARRERGSLLAGLREGRIAARDVTTFAEAFCEFQGARSLSERTRAHEQHLVSRHLAALESRRVQDITARDLARSLHAMRETYSPWTCTAIYRILAGTFSLAVRRGIVMRSPVDGLAPSERPKQRNKKAIAVLDGKSMATLVTAGGSQRWRAAIGLAGYAGLRLGELRGLRWGDVDLEANTLTVSRSLLPDGAPKATKTEAGQRTVPILPALRRLLVECKVRSPRTSRSDYVICTHDGSPVAERNLRRALEKAKKQSKLDAGEKRLSWHSLRHSFASMLATDLELPATTLARLTGHADAGFTLKMYARDGRDEATVTADVLRRAAGAGIAN
jgi:integrase